MTHQLESGGVGFALSGGGARAAVQVGALRALIEAGITPAAVTGTSAGAVNAAWLALYPGRVDDLEAIWRSLRRQDVFPGTRLGMLANVARHGFVHRADAWRAFLYRHVGGVHLEATAIPCGVVACRLADGASVTLQSGEMVTAVMASTAIPGVFPSCMVDGERYVDGGVVEYLPLTWLVERDINTIYAVDCSGFVAGPVRPAEVVDRAGMVTARALSDGAVKEAAHRGVTVHLLRPTLAPTTDARDFTATADMIQQGYDHTLEYLERSGRHAEASVPG